MPLKTQMPCATRRVSLRRREELSVLRRAPRVGGERLVKSLWTRFPDPANRVVAFVNQDTTVLFDSVGVRRTGAAAHQDDAVAAAESVVHTALKAAAFLAAHLEIGNDLAGFEHKPDSRP
jgi:hypothetical protein